MTRVAWPTWRGGRAPPPCIRQCVQSYRVNTSNNCVKWHDNTWWQPCVTLTELSGEILMDFDSSRISDIMVYRLSDNAQSYKEYMRIPLTRASSNITDCMPWMVRCYSLVVLTARRYAIERYLQLSCVCRSVCLSLSVCPIDVKNVQIKI